MKKHQVLKLLEDIPDDVEIMMGDCAHAYELKPTVVCGKMEKYTCHYCVKAPNHEGDCYCSIKAVYFTPDANLL